MARKTSQEQGRPFTKEAAMAKYYASVVAQKASGQAIEWAGGVGFTRETGIEKVSVRVWAAEVERGGG
jgi:alkylation response protein AidB-like acyl-CoA dehydrogenase